MLRRTVVAGARRPRPPPSASVPGARSRSAPRSASAPASELREAAAAGRLREVRGIGPKTEASIRAALERPASAATPAVAARPRTDARRARCRRARRRRCGRPAALAGRVRAARGRRSRRRSGRGKAHGSRRCPRSSRRSRPTSGVTHRRRSPIELHTAVPEAFGTALVRATGSPEYVASLGPASGRARREATCSGSSGSRSSRRSCASYRRAAVPRTASSTQLDDPRRPPLPHDRVRRQRARVRRDGRGARAPSATSTWRSATTRSRARRAPASTPTTCAGRPRRSPRRTRRSPRSGPARGRVRHPPRRRPRPRPTTCSPSSTGCSSRSTPDSARRGGSSPPGSRTRCTIRPCAASAIPPGA